jgi:hypothetical protein
VVTTDGQKIRCWLIRILRSHGEPAAKHGRQPTVSAFLRRQSVTLCRPATPTTRCRRLPLDAMIDQARKEFESNTRRRSPLHRRLSAHRAGRAGQVVGHGFDRGMCARIILRSRATRSTGRFGSKTVRALPLASSSRPDDEGAASIHGDDGPRRSRARQRPIRRSPSSRRPAEEGGRASDQLRPE